MVQFWKVVNNVIKESDVLLEILDARMIDETRNEELEYKVKKEGKVLIYVATKCDLVDKSFLERKMNKLSPSVFISSTEFLGITKLRERILIESKKQGIGKPIVGVLGYPNVGKSSLINALKGKKAAGVSSESGFTKGMQKIRVKGKITLFDTPGVIPFGEKDISKHIKIGAKTAKIRDPDLAVMDLMEEYPGLVEKFYGVRKKKDKESVLEGICVKKNVLRRGGEPDVDRLCRMILKDWQTGKIRLS